MKKVIQTLGLSKHYLDGENQVEVFNKLDLEVAKGEQLAIIGSSGSGKSSLLHVLGGLDHATGGEVKVLDQPLSALNESQKASFRNRHIGFIYQFHHLLMEFDALENVAMPLLIRGDKPADAKQRALVMLEKVGLSHRVKHRPGALSGGERQRVAIARALVTEPELVLADEPTGNLDHQNAMQIYQLLAELNRELGTSFVVVTHDNELAAKLDRQLRLVDGVLEAVC